MKTRDRILQASLCLFNDRGERNVTTNHLAAHLGMSPGNLYYHFKNKSGIVYELFLNYQTLVEGYLADSATGPLAVSDLVSCLESVVNGLWEYRFLHRDLEFLLETDPRLRAEYRMFTGRCLEAIHEVFRGLVAGGVLEPQQDDLRDALSVNVWLVITSWMAFLKTRELPAEVPASRPPAPQQTEAPIAVEPGLRRVIYQVLTMLQPYLAENSRAEVSRIREGYRGPV